MFPLSSIVKDFNEAGSLPSQINLFGFWDEWAFLTKSGDLGAVLGVGGMDYESFDQRTLDYAVKRLEAAFRSLDERTRLYQILIKGNRPQLRHGTHPNPLVAAAIRQRAAFLEAKAEQLYSIEIFWILMVDGQHARTGLLHALAQIPANPRSSLRELRQLFSSNHQRTLLYEQIERDRLVLQQKIQSLTRQLSDLTELDLLRAEDAFRTLRRLLNFSPSKIKDARLYQPGHIDWQLCDSELEAHRGFLRLDDHHVRVLTLKELPAETRPLGLKGLLDIPANFHVVTEWHPVDQLGARREIHKRRRHHHNSKTAFLAHLSDRQNGGPRDELVDDSKEAAIAELGAALTALEMEGKSFGEFTLTAVVYDQDPVKTQYAVAEFQKLFTQNDGLLYEEHYNLLNAFFATLPGNRQFNLRKQWALNSNHADLSFLFTLARGAEENPHLGREHLAILETAHATPYHLNLHSGDVAHTLMLGSTGSGKSFALAVLVQSMQKYDPLTCIFDLGGSYQSLTNAFRGAYLNVGLKNPGFTINPFSLAPTHENLNFLYLFARVLIEGEGKYQLSANDERVLFQAIERVYRLPEEIRTLSNLASILGPLGERLHRWTEAGQFGYLFDNALDSLSFSRFQTFNFEGWSDYPDILEPVLFYILHRASSEVERPVNAALFKVFLIDEAWIFLKNPMVRDWMIRAQKTWRKKNAAMIMATQSVVELMASEMLQVVNESCPTKIFLANPNFDRKLYGEVFQLNDIELELLESLIPKRDLLVLQPQGTKKLRLEVDSLTYWIATNNARDNVRKQEYFARYGPEEGLLRLAQDHPNPA